MTLSEELRTAALRTEANQCLARPALADLLNRAAEGVKSLEWAGRSQLNEWLDTQTITSTNIGEVRAKLMLPWDCPWNELVREETAKREQAATLTEKLPAQVLAGELQEHANRLAKDNVDGAKDDLVGVLDRAAFWITKHQSQSPAPAAILPATPRSAKADETIARELRYMAVKMLEGEKVTEERITMAMLRTAEYLDTCPDFHLGGHAKPEPDRRPRPKATSPDLEQLIQLYVPTPDGDLISKAARDNLAKLGLADRAGGFNCITSAGIKRLVELGLLHE